MKKKPRIGYWVVWKISGIILCSGTKKQYAQRTKNGSCSGFSYSENKVKKEAAAEYTCYYKDIAKEHKIFRDFYLDETRKYKRDMKLLKIK